MNSRKYNKIVVCQEESYFTFPKVILSHWISSLITTQQRSDTYYNDLVKLITHDCTT